MRGWVTNNILIHFTFLPLWLLFSGWPFSTCVNKKQWSERASGCSACKNKTLQKKVSLKKTVSRKKATFITSIEASSSVVGRGRERLDRKPSNIWCTGWSHSDQRNLIAMKCRRHCALRRLMIRLQREWRELWWIDAAAARCWWCCGGGRAPPKDVTHQNITRVIWGEIRYPWSFFTQVSKHYKEERCKTFHMRHISQCQMY